MRITFSSRVHESCVQFVEPVQTACPSRTTYLWCIRSGTPGIAAVGNGSDSTSSGFVLRRRRDHRLLRVVDVVRETDRDAARNRGRECALDDLREVVGEMEVVDRDLERLLGGRDEARERVRRAFRRLRAVGERLELDQRDAFAARWAALYSRFAA